MSNTFATLTDKKFVGENGVKMLRKTTLALLEAAVEAIEEELSTKSSRHAFSATIPTTGWTLADSLYHVTVAVQGMLATDEAGNTGPVQSGTTSTDKARLKAWNKVTRITAGADSITVYATEVPSVSIPILMEVFR